MPLANDDDDFLFLIDDGLVYGYRVLLMVSIYFWLMIWSMVVIASLNHDCVY